MSRKTELTWKWVGCFALVLVASFWVPHVVVNHHKMEGDFADRYQVTNVDQAWIESRVWYTTTDGTKRCQGRFDGEVLSNVWCTTIEPPVTPHPAEVPR